MGSKVVHKIISLWMYYVAANAITVATNHIIILSVEIVYLFSPLTSHWLPYIFQWRCKPMAYDLFSCVVALDMRSPRLKLKASV